MNVHPQRLVLPCLLGATLAAGCGCPPPPQQPVRLPDTEQPAGETGANEAAESEPAPSKADKGKKPAPPP